MIDSFKTKGTEDVFNGIRSKAARKTCPESIWSVAVRKLSALDYAAQLSDRAWPPGNGLEALKGDRKGQISIDLLHPRRLYIMPDHDPVPEKEDGGLDRAAVTRVLVVGIDDPH